MGAWGPGIFSNDTSSDVRGEFREMVEDGLSAEEATAKLISEWAHAVEDPEDRTSFWTGLAATQLQLGRLLPHVREKAIEVIDSGGDLHLWAETGPTGARKAALEKLRHQLLGPQKDPVKVKPPTKIFAPVEAGQTVEWKLPDGREAYLKVLAVKPWRQGSYPILEIVDSQGRTFMEQQPNLGGLAARPREAARYAVIEARKKHLPKPEELRVVRREPAGPVDEPRTYTGWRGLAITCQRLLDDPGARPKSGWRGLLT
jgi:hypothetical protein